MAGGALAGVAGAAAMSLFQTITSRARGSGDQNPAHSPPEADAAAGSEDERVDPAVAAAQRIARWLRGARLPSREARVAASALHYAVGGASGAVYGATTAAFGPTRAGRGALFGAAC